MREWKMPEIWTLGAEFTEQGGHKGANDGYHYDNVLGQTLIGASGTSLAGKPINPAKPNGAKYGDPIKNK